MIAVITTLIYGVRPVGNQCEEGIKLLAIEVREKLPLVANLLLEKRYINDLGNSSINEKETDSMINKGSLFCKHEGQGMGKVWTQPP